MTTVRVPLIHPTRLGWRWVAAGLGVVSLAIVLGAVLGPAGIGVGDAFREVLSAIPFSGVESPLSDVEREILWSWRFPRVALGLLVGSTLAISGAAYQGVFRNPLAEPYLLGIASGAALGATISFVIGAPALLVPMAFVGGIIAVALTYTLGRSVGDRTSTTLILAGVAMASFLTALTTFVQQRNTETLREVFSWVLGRLSTSGWREVAILAPYAIVSTVVMLLYRRRLDILAVGDDEATSLGVDVARVRIIVIVAATLATAAAVSVSGLIPFVGIIVPHAIRLVAGSSYRLVMPLSLLIGGAFLVGADLIARQVMAPAELPIGVVTAFFGAPFFLLVLRSSRGVA